MQTSEFHGMTRRETQNRTARNTIPWPCNRKDEDAPGTQLRILSNTDSFGKQHAWHQQQAERRMYLRDVETSFIMVKVRMRI